MSAKNWHRTALEMGRERDNALAQLRYEQANRRKAEAAYRIEQEEYLQHLEAAIERIRELHRPVGLTEHTGPRIKPSGAPIPDDTPVCGYCTDPDALGWCEYPCPTIEALDDGKEDDTSGLVQGG